MIKTLIKPVLVTTMLIAYSGGFKGWPTPPPPLNFQILKLKIDFSLKENERLGRNRLTFERKFRLSGISNVTNLFFQLYSRFHFRSRKKENKRLFQSKGRWQKSLFLPS